MNNNENQMLDSIPSPLTRENTNTVLWWLTKKDLIFCFTSLLIFAIVWLPLFFTKNIIPAIIVLAISLLITLFFVIPFGTGRVYIILAKMLSFKNKKSFEVSNFIEKNGLIVKKDAEGNNEYISFYKIKGINTDLIDKTVLMGMYNNLANFFCLQNEQKRFELVKISANNQYEINKKASENVLINKFLNKNAEFISNLNESETKKVNKFILILYTKKEFDNFLYKNEIENILKISKLSLVEASQEEISKIKNDIWFENCFVFQKPNSIKTINKENKETKFYKILGINKLPLIVGSEWITSISEFKNVDFIFKCTPYDPNKSKKILDKAILNAKYETERNKISAQQTEIDHLNYEILSETASKVAQTGAIFLSTCSYLIISANTTKELDKKVNDIKMKYKYIDSGLESFSFNQFEAYFSLFEKKEKISKEIGYDILSTTLGFGFPYQNNSYFDKNSFCLGIDEENQLIGIDWTKNLSKEENANLIVQGISGSGKTTTAKQIMLSQIASDEFNVYVIDPENEYSQLIHDAGGSIIDLSNPDCFINPFHYIKNEVSNMDSQLQNNEIFFKFLFEDAWNTETKTVLLNACKELYLKNKNEFTFTDLYNYLTKHYKEYKTIHEVIKLYTKNGVYGEVWDKKTNIKIENKSIAFNFQDITNSYSNSFKEAKIFLLLKLLENKVIENKAKKEHKYISIFIDEGHLFTSPKMIDTLMFIFNWFKRIRKYHGMIAFLTQNINDLLGNKELLHLTSAIFNNTNYLIFLKLSPNEIKQLDYLLNDLGGLSDYEKEYLITANKGQGILFLENIRTRIQVIKNI